MDHYRCINETFAISPVMTLRLVSPLSLACSSINSLCWFELDRALTLLPGNLSKDNMSKLKVWWIYVEEKRKVPIASWAIKSTWLTWRGQQSPIHNRGQGGPFHPLVTLTKLKVHASMLSGASEEKKKTGGFCFLQTHFSWSLSTTMVALTFLVTNILSGVKLTLTEFFPHIPPASLPLPLSGLTSWIWNYDHLHCNVQNSHPI